MFKKGERGIARPTCLSINNVVRNYSPCDDDQTVLVAGDVVKMYVSFCRFRNIVCIFILKYLYFSVNWALTSMVY